MLQMTVSVRACRPVLSSHACSSHLLPDREINIATANHATSSVSCTANGCCMANTADHPSPFVSTQCRPHPSIACRFGCAGACTCATDCQNVSVLQGSLRLAIHMMVPATTVHFSLGVLCMLCLLRSAFVARPDPRALCWLGLFVIRLLTTAGSTAHLEACPRASNTAVDDTSASSLCRAGHACVLHKALQLHARCLSSTWKGMEDLWKMTLPSTDGAMRVALGRPHHIAWLVYNTYCFTVSTVFFFMSDHGARMGVKQGHGGADLLFWHGMSTGNFWVRRPGMTGCMR